ncbi:MAG: ATP-binding protein [Desulfobulbaceae bacterium]|nr:ATP-binding protein [Desulfobulbaceae bacterium]
MPKLFSIQQKITYSFSTMLILLFATAVISYAIMVRVEEKLHRVEVIDDFLNLTLELRRYEKNYFLYHLNEDFKDNRLYLDRIESTIENNNRIFAYYNPDEQLENIEDVLGTYKYGMLRLHEINLMDFNSDLSGDQERIRETIRDAGKKLTSYAEIFAKREKSSIQNLLKTSRTLLVVSTGALVFLSLVMSMILGEKIFSSLKLLEKYTRKVAHGEIVDPPEKDVEKEIHSLFQAFTRMNNELRLRQQQMVQSEKLASLGTLLAGVAHELNNPLSNISTSAQILEEEIDSPNKDFHHRLVAQIEEQSDKARDIVRTLLEFSRTKEFKKEELVLNNIVSSAIRLLRSEIPSEIEIEIDMPSDLMVSADKQRMQQVFLNLIKNAVDAIENKGKIWISARDFISDGRKEVEILVSDNGPGIAPELLRKIFDPFFSSKDVGKGSGLGLFIVHDIIASHGGTISVDSRLGEGTTFIIWLPGGHTA